MSDEAKQGPRSLGVPPGALEDPDAAEILRAWIARNGLEVSFLKVWDEPDNWGIFLADLARHAARAYAAEGIHSESNALARIRDMLDAEWDRPTDVGVTRADRKQ